MRARRGCCSTSSTTSTASAHRCDRSDASSSAARRSASLRARSGEQRGRARRGSSRSRGSVPTVTRSAPARPSGAAGAHQHPARRPAPPTTSRLVRAPRAGRTRRSWPATRPARARALRRPVLQLEPLGEVALDAAGDLVLVPERLDRRGLGGGVAEERLAHLVDGNAEAPPSRTARSRRAGRRARRPSRTCAAGRGSGGGRAASIDSSGSCEQVELAVGLVEDHRDVARDARARTRRSRSSGSAVEVGLFGLQTITSRVAAVISRSIASRS